MQVIRALFLVSTIAFSGAAALAQPADHGLEEVLIESASTPAQHQALAKHFKAKAEAARKEAENHRAMAKTYTGTKLTMREAMTKHCADLAASYDAQAKAYDAMAAAHEEAAKK